MARWLRGPGSAIALLAVFLASAVSVGALAERAAAAYVRPKATTSENGGRPAQHVSHALNAPSATAMSDYFPALQSTLNRDASDGYDNLCELDSPEVASPRVSFAAKAPTPAPGPPVKGVPKTSPNFKPPTNAPQAPPTQIPPGWRVRVSKL